MKIFNQYRHATYIGAIAVGAIMPITMAIAANAMPAPFVDENFYSCVESQYSMNPDTSAPGEDLNDEQLAQMTWLTCDGAETSSEHNIYRDIKNLTGIEKMTNLRRVAFFHNSIVSANFSQNQALEHISFLNNPLTSINLSQNTQLTSLEIQKTQLENLDLSSNTRLAELFISDNPNLGYLDISNNPDIYNLLSDGRTMLDTGVIGDKENVSYVFDFSALEFLDPNTQDADELYTISDSDIYSYDAENRILTVLDIDATHGYVRADSVSGDDKYVLSLCLRTSTGNEDDIADNPCNATSDDDGLPDNNDSTTDDEASSEGINAPNTGGNLAGDANNANSVNIASVITYLSLALLGASVSIFAIMKLTRHHVKF